MSVGSTYALARRLRKRLDPKLIEFVNDPDQMLLSDRVGAISGIGYVRAVDGEPTTAFHERLKGLARARGAAYALIGPSEETLREEARLRCGPADL
jgi:hypothetical protein